MSQLPNQIVYNDNYAWKTGMVKVEPVSGKEVYEYSTADGKRVYRSEDGTVIKDGD